MKAILIIANHCISLKFKGYLLGNFCIEVSVEYK